MFFHIFAERNLNPKAACLKRREEEKAEDGPKLPGHLAAHITHPHPHPHAHSQPPFPAMPVRRILLHLLPINYVRYYKLLYFLGSTTFPSAQSNAATVAAALRRYHPVLRGRYTLKLTSLQI